MKFISISEAKAQLSKLVEDALNGEEVIISRAGKPVIQLVVYSLPKKQRKPGSLKGKIWIAPDFDELPTDISEAFGISER